LTTGECAVGSCQPSDSFLYAVLSLQWDPRHANNCLAISVLLRRAWQVITHLCQPSSWTAFMKGL